MQISRFASSARLLERRATANVGLRHAHHRSSALLPPPPKRRRLNGLQRRSASWHKKTLKKLNRMKEKFVYAASFNGPRVAIMGRPNVGKSFLFNRFCQRNLAIVDNTPGVTRDRKIGQGRIGDLEFSVVDTPGYEERPSGQELGLRVVPSDGARWEVHERMLEQCHLAMDNSDVCLLLFDGRDGVTESDRAIAKYVKRWLVENPEKDVQVIPIINKMEASVDPLNVMAEFPILDLGEPCLISAEQKEGWVDLFHTMDEAFHKIGRNLAPQAIDGELDKMLKLAIVGRPNVGKSTLINKLIKENRLVTGNVPRLTRDSVNIQLHHKELDAHFNLIDTAGVVGLTKRRKREFLYNKPENLAMEESMRSIKEANVVVVMVDVSEAVLASVNHTFTDHEAFDTTESDTAIHTAKCIIQGRDKQLIRFCLEEGKCVVLCLNKWDLLPAHYQQRQVVIGVQKYLPQLLRDYGMIPFLSTSALFDDNIEQILPTALKLYQKWGSRINSAKLNQFVKEAQRLRVNPTRKGRKLRVRYATQYSIRPPCFTFFCGSGGIIPETYLRYLRNCLRDEFELAGIPLRVTCRSNVTENPYKDKMPGYGTKDYFAKQDQETWKEEQEHLKDDATALKILRRRGQVDEDGNAIVEPEKIRPDPTDENDLTTGWAGYTGKVYRKHNKRVATVVKRTSTG